MKSLLNATVFHFFLILLPHSSKAWRVLVVNPFAGGSHQTVSLYLANLLANNGHHVTYLSTNLPKKLHSEIVKLDLPVATEVANKLMDEAADRQTKGIESTWKQKYEVLQGMTNICKRFYEEPNVQMLMRSGQRFDLLIVLGAMDSCGISLGQHLKINNTVLHMPGPFLLPTQMNYLGIPLYASSYKLDGFRFAESSEIRESMVARAVQLIKRLSFDAIVSLFFRYTVDTVAYKQIPEYSGYKNVYENVRMIFMHYHPHSKVDLPFPLGPGVINLGATTCDVGYNESEIQEDMRQFVDASSGFLLVSFGSHVESLLEEEVELWIKVFSTLPYSVVWRLVGQKATLPDNIRTYQWLPQQALLQHPKIKLFISHGGYGSKIESTCAGVPILFVPRFAEQFESAQQYVDIGVAEQVLIKPGVTKVEEITSKITRTLEVHSKTMKEVSKQVMLTRVTDKQVMGYLDMAVAGLSLLPGYQPWWQLLYLDIIFLPILTIMLIRFLIRRYKSSR